MGRRSFPRRSGVLDVNSGVHLDRIAGEPGSETYAVFDEDLESTVFWSRATLGLWNDNHTDGVPGALITPPQFQVASCGGSAAEGSSLVYCNSSDIKNNGNSAMKVDDKSDSATQSTSSNVALSSGTSSSSPVTPSNIAPFVPTRLLMSGDLTLLGQCDGVSMVCAPIHINPPATVIDSSAPESPVPLIDSSAPESPTPPIGDLTPPIDPSPPEVVPPNQIFVDDPGLGQRPIPEAPTWVMTTIGFSIVALFFRSKKRGRTNPISIIDAEI